MTVCESRISDPWTTMTCQWLEGEIKRLKAYSLLLRLRWHSPVVYTQSWSWSASRNKMPVAQSPMFHNLHHIRRLICSWSCREHDRSKEDVSLALPGWQQTPTSSTVSWSWWASLKRSLVAQQKKAYIVLNDRKDYSNQQPGCWQPELNMENFVRE